MEKKLQKTTFYKLEFFHGVRFMTSSSSIFPDNLAERIHEMKICT